MAETPDARFAQAFADDPDPRAYVPRLALESALAELAEGIGKTPACAALTGGAGLGKTHLLHVLRERLEGSFECLYVRPPRLEPFELWRWTADALGLGRGDDDREAVLGRARRLAAEGMGLVLLVDDAGVLPASTRAQLLAACSTRGLSLVLAFDTANAAQLASLPPQVRRVDLGPPMTAPELRAYVQTRLRRAGVDDALAAQLGPAQLAALHQASGGVPARLHALLGARALGPRVAPPAAAKSAPVRARSALARVSPRVRLALAALLVLLLAGVWTFALNRAPGVASVGVPVEHLETPREKAPPAAAPAPAVPAAPEAPVLPPPLPGTDTSEAMASEAIG